MQRPVYNMLISLDNMLDRLIVNVENSELVAKAKGYRLFSLKDLWVGFLWLLVIRTWFDIPEVTCTHKPGDLWAEGCCTSRRNVLAASFFKQDLSTFAWAFNVYIKIY